uniref:Predicted nucleotide-binding protein containing TIR -like domain n=1 Tax=Candidatus Kentrum sp. TC TaxID=2126339 RepID=A0A450ZYX4_9GAMM|nr:MAG: Predicted nucleotide-binding protein containing TIR -like domain [Candidatus Kentron sp. TC]
MNRAPKSKALARLRKALDAIPDLKRQYHRNSPGFEKWRRDTEIAIANTFGEKSRHVGDFRRISFSRANFLHHVPDSAKQDAYVEGLESASSVLESMIDEVEEYWEDDDRKPATPRSQSTPSETDKIFIIHGRDGGTKETVARFIETLDLKPVILHEQSNRGRTIIEKFEKHAEVGFAIALLTPDDRGALQGHEKDLKPRARQNVIFEFGYFMGRLGRQRVCALTKGDVEPPSDWAGVVYIPLDGPGAWKMGLVKELKAAGFEVDANRAL